MKILLPIDESSCSSAAVQTVIQQFRPEDAEVRVLHVDEWPKDLPTSLAFSEGPSAAQQIVTLHEERCRRHRALVGAAARRLEAARFHATTELREGDARHGILDAAAAWKPDLIVLGSHGRRGVARFLLGSVSDNVVRHAACSVQIVRDGDGTSGADTVR
jgi:nucleotide-binding universal stress UspA family protein